MLMVRYINATIVNTLVFLKVEDAISLPCSASSATEAEEAAHEAFTKAYWALGRFRPGKPFRPWLLTIVANEARNRRRSAGRGHALALRAADEARLSDPAPSAEATVLGPRWPGGRHATT